MLSAKHDQQHRSNSTSSQASLLHGNKSNNNNNSVCHDNTATAAKDGMAHSDGVLDGNTTQIKQKQQQPAGKRLKYMCAETLKTTNDTNYINNHAKYDGMTGDTSDDDDDGDADDFEGSQNEQQQQQRHHSNATKSSCSIRSSSNERSLSSDKASTTGGGTTRGRSRGRGVNEQERERRREELRRARAERKRCREKERRSNVNKEYVELTSVLMKIDSSGFSAKDVTLAECGAPASRLDLISRTVLVLERLHDENKQLKQQLASSSSTTASDNNNNTTTGDINTNHNNNRFASNTNATAAATSQSEAAFTASSNTSGYPKNHDMIGTLLVPVMVPIDYPLNRLMLNRDNSIEISSRLPPETMFPLGFGPPRGSLMGVNKDGITYSTGNSMPNFGYHGPRFSYAQQQQQHGTNNNSTSGYLPTASSYERVPTVEVEAMLSLNRSMPSPAPQHQQQQQQQMASSSSSTHQHDEARLACLNNNIKMYQTSRSPVVRVIERKDYNTGSSSNNTQQPRFSGVPK